MQQSFHTARRWYVFVLPVFHVDVTSPFTPTITIPSRIDVQYHTPRRQSDSD
jgi:hypothetical protein